jgi:hypothetical protein
MLWTLVLLVSLLLTVTPAYAHLQSYTVSNDFTPCTGGYEHVSLPAPGVNVTIWGWSLAHLTEDPGGFASFSHAGVQGPGVVGQGEKSWYALSIPAASTDSLGTITLYCKPGGHHWYYLTVWYRIPAKDEDER